MQEICPFLMKFSKNISRTTQKKTCLRLVLILPPRGGFWMSKLHYTMSTPGSTVQTTFLIPCLLFFKFIHPNIHMAAPVFYISKTSSLYFDSVCDSQLKAVSHQLLTPQ